MTIQHESNETIKIIFGLLLDNLRSEEQFFVSRIHSNSVTVCVMVGGGDSRLSVERELLSSTLLARLESGVEFADDLVKDLLYRLRNAE